MNPNDTNNPTPINNSGGQPNNFNQNFGGQKVLPNSVAVLVLGICSIFPGCFCAGIVGIVCGIIALVLSKKAKVLYDSEPSAYTLSSFNNLKAGRVCAIIGLCLSSLILIIYIIYFAILGAAVSMIPWSNLR